MHPERWESVVDERLRIRWQTTATVALLGIALGVSVATGHLGDALIIGVFFVAGLGVLAGTVFLRRKTPRRDDAAGR
jgi:uncharacterized membrane protein YhiD involved in acid resistance